LSEDPQSSFNVTTSVASHFASNKKGTGTGTGTDADADTDAATSPTTSAAFASPPFVTGNALEDSDIIGRAGRKEMRRSIAHLFYHLYGIFPCNFLHFVKIRCETDPVFSEKIQVVFIIFVIHGLLEVDGARAL
jgi:hypothetical protein